MRLSQIGHRWQVRTRQEFFSRAGSGLASVALGAWVTYGLGAASENLPTFVVLLDDREPVGGPKNWSSGFLPATYQETQFRNGDTPIPHLRNPNQVSAVQQRSKLDFLRELNERSGADKQDDTELEVRIRAYGLAFQMRAAGSEAVDLSRESDATKSRGMLEETLVVWGGEFGGTPFNEKGDGRDHKPWGSSIRMAGGGVKGGRTSGSIDENGLRAVVHSGHVHDIHVSILDALGLDHEMVTDLHNGRPERPTVTAGKIIQELFA
ncbi:MAG: DUF1501 domain-containing protein [Bryobacteraceae bacterium]|nr:DUF1501 domain-containing protein [Bryobacteraceae bacterium]MDW8379654.1 DUF1501 domain-containing protein [Bryobacterales bacterium]